MSLITILNILFLNIVAWVIFSYFWGGWNYRAYKPWKWIDLAKQKLITNVTLKAERNTKDKNRVHQFWLTLNHIDEREVQGDIVFVGIEELDFVKMAVQQNPSRKVFVYDTFADKDYNFNKESCEGAVSDVRIFIKGVSEEEVKGLSKSVTTYSGVMGESVKAYFPRNVALAWIDTIEYDALTTALPIVYKALQPGAIMLVHDYNHQWEQVERALNAFLVTVAEEPVPLADMYGTVALAKSKKA